MKFAKSFIWVMKIYLFRTGKFHGKYIMIPLFLLMLMFFSIISFYSYDYDAALKLFMKRDYNFSVGENIKLFFKNNKNLIIRLDDIEKIEINCRKLPYKKFLLRRNFAYKREDSNFYYDVSEIKVILKDPMKLKRNIKDGIFYNFFNIKKEKNCIYLYEIMYNEKSKENVKYLENLMQNNNNL